MKGSPKEFSAIIIIHYCKSTFILPTETDKEPKM